MRVGIHNDTSAQLFESTLCQVGQIRPTARDLSRFWSKVHKTDGCWLWTASVSGGKHGRSRLDQKYGQFTIGSRTDGSWRHIGAHVFAYLVTYGPIPDGQQIRHTCDRSLCVRPDHLTVGTFKQNMEDAAERGRLHTARPRRHKITPQQIDEIRVCLRAGETQYRVADRYGITSAYAGRLAKGLARQFDAPLAASVEQAG